MSSLSTPIKHPDKIDLKAVDNALRERRIELPAGVTPGGTFQTVSVVPLGPNPTEDPQMHLVASPEQDTNSHAFHIDAAMPGPPPPSASGTSGQKSLTVPEGKEPFYGARSAA